MTIVAKLNSFRDRPQRKIGSSKHCAFRDIEDRNLFCFFEERVDPQDLHLCFMQF